MIFFWKIILFLIWLIVATYAYGILCSNGLECLPDYPVGFGKFVSAVTGMDHSEDIEALTAYYVLIGSFVVVLPATLLGILVWKGLRALRRAIV